MLVYPADTVAPPCSIHLLQRKKAAKRVLVEEDRKVLPGKARARHSFFKSKIAVRYIIEAIVRILSRRVRFNLNSKAIIVVMIFLNGNSDRPRSVQSFQIL